MLTPRLRFFARRAAALTALLAAAVTVAALLGAANHDAPPDRVRPGATVPPAAVVAVPATTVLAGAAAQRVRRATAQARSRLRAAVARAAGLGGVVEAAVMLDGWDRPVIARSAGTGSSHDVRMWSISKVVTAVTLLREMGWGDRPGDPIRPELDAALTGALTRSENCRQRRVVLGLQEQAGSTDRAATLVADTFAIAGARPQIARKTQLADATCDGYLADLQDVRSPTAPALMLGTSRWGVGDAARFAHALGSGDYGRAVRTRLLALMRRAKEASREAPSGNYTAALDWGAGRALGCLRPAFKAGWGGAQARRFVAEQIAIVRHGGRTGAIAVTFQPARQPARDDPGATVAPAGIEAVMRAMDADLGGSGSECAAPLG